jgi:hypothetical protein
VLASSTANLLPDSGATGAAVTVGLPDHPLPGTIGHLDRIALVNVSVFNQPSDARGACYELYCTRLNEIYAAYGATALNNFCVGTTCSGGSLCPNGKACPMNGCCGATLAVPPLCLDQQSTPQGETTPGSTAFALLGRVDPAATSGTDAVEFVNVSDEAPVIQALRQEVSPNGPEIAGLLGTEVLQRMDVEIDYPGLRLMFGCAEGEDQNTCRIQPGHNTSTNLPCCGSGGSISARLTPQPGTCGLPP